MSAQIVLVLARAENGVIGKSGGLPWRLSRDLKHYKALTMAKPIIMGRKTHQSIGRPLPGRENIVVSRDRAFVAEGCQVVGDLDAAVTLARSICEKNGASEICIVGGAQIYRAMEPLAERIYLTEIHMIAEGDVVLDAFDCRQWTEVSRTRFEPEGDDSAAFSFVVLERAN